MIDLRNCKPGDTLISRGGLEFTYVFYDPSEPYYPHSISRRERIGSRCNDGKFWPDGTETEEDIIEIIEVVAQ